MEFYFLGIIRKNEFNWNFFFNFSKSDKFETDIIKNHVLSFVVNNTSSTRCLFLNIINTIQFNLSGSTTTISTTTTTSGSNASVISSAPHPHPISQQHQVKFGQTGDDLKYRFKLFNLITKMGTNCKHLDPDLTGMLFLI